MLEGIAAMVVFLASAAVSGIACWAVLSALFRFTNSRQRSSPDRTQAAGQNGETVNPNDGR